MRRLLNKPRSKGDEYSKNYDPVAYIEAMKEFQTRTRGMLKDDEQYTEIRNEIYKRLRSSRTESQITREEFVAPDFDSFYINLIVVPEELECFEIMHIMQYNQIMFHLEEDNILRSKLGLRDIRKDMGFTKNDTWPFLIVDSSSESIETAAIQGKDNIMDYFQTQGLMTDVRTHSAYETQGLAWVEDKAIPAFDLLKSTLRGRFQFNFTSKSFRYSQPSLEASKILSKYIWKIYRTFYFHLKSFKTRREVRDQIKNRFQLFHEMLDEWEKRLGEHRYHGGNRPDAVDFKMYSLSTAHHHMFTVKKLLSARSNKDSKFDKWYKDMNNNCRNSFE